MSVLNAVRTELNDKGLRDTVSSCILLNYGLPACSHDTYQDVSNRLSSSIRCTDISWEDKLVLQEHVAAFLIVATSILSKKQHVVTQLWPSVFKTSYPSS